MVELAVAYDLRAAERFCEQMARREAANFYWGFIALPRPQRTAIYALYDFARQVDDDADLDGSTNRLERLDHHRHRLHHARPGDSTDPVMSVLAHAMARYSIPTAELEMLIDGVEMDLTTTRYASWEELREYCHLVASVVGRMCVRIFGFRDPRALERADELGISLQLINILRDVREDFLNNRIYLPKEDLDKFGIEFAPFGEPEPFPGEAMQARFASLVEFEANRAREWYGSGLRLLATIDRRSAACTGAMAGIYRRLLERIARNPHAVLEGRMSLPGSEKALVAAQALAGFDRWKYRKGAPR